MMSGEPSGLREIDWNSAPAAPSAAPTSSAVSARGNRKVLTTKPVALSPWPSSVAITSPGAIG